MIIKLTENQLSKLEESFDIKILFDKQSFLNAFLNSIKNKISHIKNYITSYDRDINKYIFKLSNIGSKDYDVIEHEAEKFTDMIYAT